MADKKSAYRMLLLIATPKLVNKGAELFREEDVPIQHVFHAQGTASSEIMDMLGLGGIEKNILMSMMTKPFADKMLKKLQKKLHLGMPNSGIAFTIPMSGGSAQIVKLMETLQSEEANPLSERDETDMAESEYSMIMAIVNQGFSEEVMDAAKPVGATGGTVFHSRRVGNVDKMKFWGISVQQEREIVLVLARKADKLNIMQAIGKQCGINSKAQGIVLSLPVDGTAGMD